MKRWVAIPLIPNPLLKVLHLNLLKSLTEADLVSYLEEMSFPPLFVKLQ